MKVIRFASGFMTLFALTCFFAGASSAGAGQDNRGEPTAVVSAQPAVISQEGAALIEELKAARASGDQARVKEILNIISPGPVREIQSIAPDAALPPPEAGPAPAGQGAGITPAFAGDVLVSDFAQIDANPDMVSTASGKYYLVRDRADDACMDVFTSSDGGHTWSWFYWLCDGTANIQNPAIAVPEFAEDFAYVVYEINYEIKLLKIDLNTLGNAFYTIQPANYDPSGFPHGSHRPRIVTDNNDYNVYYLYVTYIEDSWGDVPNMVKTARSLDKGVTWGDYRYPENFPSNVFEAKYRVDIAYGNTNQELYVTWDQNVFLSGKDVFVSRSSDFGATWDTPVNMCGGTSSDCFEPRVAAIQDGAQVMVVYTEFFGAPFFNDVVMGYSTDQGTTWSSGWLLPWTNTYDERPDITVDPTLGDFHVAFWSAWDIRYTHASSATPTQWSPLVVVNDTQQASWEYSPATVAVDWNSKMACLAWSDSRMPTHAIYSDCFDTTAPSGWLSINGGAVYTTSTSVTLAPSCADAESGCSEMRFSNDFGVWSAWEPYSTIKTWTLNSGDGSHDVDVQFKDKAGNVSAEWVIYDTIVLDTTAPSGTVLINGGAASTNTTAVTLALSCSDAGSGCSQMRFSNDNATWSVWEAYGVSKAWTLTGGDGTKTVYVQHRDIAGNASGSFFDTIILQTLPNVTITLVPDTPSVPRGGTLGYTVTATNNTATTQAFQYWTYVTLPNGSRYPAASELFGPVNVALNPGQTGSAHLTHAIPTVAPLGTYTYHGNAGPYPTVGDSDSFQFSVTP